MGGLGTGSGVNPVTSDDKEKNQGGGIPVEVSVYSKGEHIV